MGASLSALFSPAQLPRGGAPVHVVVVGGSFAGVSAAQQCAARGAHVTLVEPREGVAIAYAVLRAAIVGSKGLGVAVVPLDRVFSAAARRGGRCRTVRGYAVRVNLEEGHVIVREAAPAAAPPAAGAEAASGAGAGAAPPPQPLLLRLPYAVLILATGTVPAYAPVSADNLCNVAALREGTSETSAAAARARHFVVCGGGATGIDVATALRHEYPLARVTLVHRGPMLLSSHTFGLNYSTAVRVSARKQLEARGIDVLCETEVVGPPRPLAMVVAASDGSGSEAAPAAPAEAAAAAAAAAAAVAAPLRYAGASIVLGEMELELSGRGAVGAGAAGRLRCDYLINATGLQPSTRWLRESLPASSFDARGQLRVDSAYRVRGCGGDVFALGDVCDSMDPKTASVLPFIARAIASNVVRLVRHGGLDASLERGSGAPSAARRGPQAPASESHRGIVLGLAVKSAAPSSAAAAASAKVLPASAASAPAADPPPCALLSRAATADALLWSAKQERAKRAFVARFARQAGYSYGELMRLHRVDAES
jgi:NADH dehydrogenase FAD-containing subunit